MMTERIKMAGIAPGLFLFASASLLRDMHSRHREEPTGPAFGGPDDKLRDEAIQPSCDALDCFALLAMTGKMNPIAVHRERRRT
jgi:hypothetical protein